MMYRHHDTLTYRHPRNTLEAFGPDATTACAVQRHTYRTAKLVQWLLRAVTLGLAGLAVIGALT